MMGMTRFEEVMSAITGLIRLSDRRLDIYEVAIKLVDENIAQVETAAAIIRLQQSGVITIQPDNTVDLNDTY